MQTSFNLQANHVQLLEISVKDTSQKCTFQGHISEMKELLGRKNINEFIFQITLNMCLRFCKH